MKLFSLVYLQSLKQCMHTHVSCMSDSNSCMLNVTLTQNIGALAEYLRMRDIECIRSEELFI